MAIIYSYPLNGNIKSLDELVGTTKQNINGQSKTVTRNFLLSDLVDFFSINGLQKELTLTTNGVSGPATLNQTTGTLNIPQYSGGSGGSQNLQQVTDLGASTTKAIIINTNSEYQSLTVTNNLETGNVAIIANSQYGDAIYANSGDGNAIVAYSDNGNAINANSNNGVSLYTVNTEGKSIQSFINDGVAEELNLGSTAKGIVINSGTSSTGNFIELVKNGINKLTVNQSGEVIATKLIKEGGTSAQYLMADGSVSTGGTGGGGIASATASGTDIYTATIPGITSYNDGDAYLIRFTNGNTTGCSININSLGAITLYRNNDGPLIGGDIQSSGEMLCVYNSASTSFQCIGTSPNSIISYITNADSVTITKGQPVYAFGGTGDRMTVKLAYNIADSTSAQTVGLVMSASIAASQKGFIIMQGLLDGLSTLPTTTFADGDSIYLGPTAGAITKVKQYAPNHLVYLGFVTTASPGSAGRMYVRIQNGYELDELHNVQAQNPINKDTLYYDNTVSPTQWKTASIPTILGYTPANDTGVVHLAGTETITGNKTFSGTTSGITKAMVGLQNVDNTSDANKPISTATQTALDSKEPLVTAGTTTQYWRGDKTWQTFPTIPTVGSWGGLNYPTWSTGTPFVKMTGVGTFALDTNIYEQYLGLPSVNGYVLSSTTSGVRSWIPMSGGGGSGITSLNTLTGSSQTFTVGVYGADFNISSIGTTHTFNMPSASKTVRGVITTTNQGFAGIKQFDDTIIANGTVGQDAAIVALNIGNAISAESDSGHGVLGQAYDIGAGIKGVSAAGFGGDFSSGQGVGLNIDNALSNLSNLQEWKLGGVVKAYNSAAGDFVANSFIKIGGTSSQFLMANGSTSNGLTLQQVTTLGNYITNQIQIDTAFNTSSNEAGLISINAGIGSGIYGESNNGYGVYGYSDTNKAIFGYGASTAVGISGYSEAGVAGEFNTGGSTIAQFKQSNVVKVSVSGSGNVTANSFIKTGSSSSQVLLGDGSTSSFGINTIIVTSGSSFTTPATITTSTVFIIELVGAGGGGGGGAAGISANGSSAGGGGYVYKKITGLTPSTTYTCAIGVGGAGGAFSLNGTSGTSTTLTIGAVTYTASGGGFGIGVVSSTGGAGGTGTNGDINIVGQTGGDSSGASATVPSPSGGGSPKGWGLGGLGVFTPKNGNNATGYGGGGSAGKGTTASPTGGNGTNGIIYCTYYN